jgi:hypothetical protein
LYSEGVAVPEDSPEDNCDPDPDNIGSPYSCYPQENDRFDNQGGGGTPPSWIPLYEDRGSGKPGNVLQWLPQARKWLTTFKTKAKSPCGKDLSAIGLTSATVQSIAKDPSVTIMNAATSNPQIYAELEQDHADFGLPVGTNTIYYDQNYFWQSSMQLVMATLIHEFSHVNGKNDPQDQGALSVTVGAASSNITLQIATDCFGYRK